MDKKVQQSYAIWFIDFTGKG